MASEWPTVRLGDYVDANLGKMLDARKNKGTPKPYLGNSNVRWGSFDLSNLALMKFEEDEDERYGIRDGDLIICEGGEPGRCAIWREEVPDMKIQKALHRVRPKESLNNYYLFYWLRLTSSTGRLEPFFTGTTIKHLTGKALSELELPLPPLFEQHAIARILGALDDKIELNRRMNQTLEAMARALFKSWFVDFDGVLLENMQESELGLIPKGWRAGTVADVCKVIFSGGTPDTRKPEYWNGDLPWFSSGETRNRIIISAEKFITQAGVDGSSTRAAKPGDILIAAAGQGHTRGQTSYCVIDTYINQSVVAARPDVTKCHPAWLYYNLERRYEEMRMLSDSHSSRGSFTTKLLGAMPIVIPTADVMQKFGSIAESLLASQVKNDHQSQTLAELRDTLLPKLISGELRVKDAERIVENVPA